MTTNYKKAGKSKQFNLKDFLDSIKDAQKHLSIAIDKLNSIDKCLAEKFENSSYEQRIKLLTARGKFIRDEERAVLENYIQLQKCYSLLYERYYIYLKKHIKHKFSFLGYSDIDEILHDTFEEQINNLDKFRGRYGENSLKASLRTIAENKSKDILGYMCRPHRQEEISENLKLQDKMTPENKYPNRYKFSQSLFDEASILGQQVSCRECKHGKLNNIQKQQNEYRNNKMVSKTDFTVLDGDSIPQQIIDEIKKHFTPEEWDFLLFVDDTKPQDGKDRTKRTRLIKKAKKILNLK